jgi:hypothetical protein
MIADGNKVSEPLNNLARLRERSRGAARCDHFLHAP